MGLSDFLSARFRRQSSTASSISISLDPNRPVIKNVQKEIDFALILLRFQNPRELFAFSPVCISFGFSLIHSGAAGSTKDQIRDFVLKGTSHKHFEKHFAKLNHSLLRAENGTEMCMANHLFADITLEVKNDYLQKIERLFRSGVTQLPFFENSHGSAVSINTFVGMKTKNHIGRFMNDLNFPIGASTILVNAAYFLSDWSTKFDGAQTTKLNFHTNHMEKRQIDFLSSSRPVLYSENNEFRVLTLRYKAESFAMSIFLPINRFGLREAIMGLNSVKVQNLLTRANEEQIHILIPKWKIECDFPLTDAMPLLDVAEMCGPFAELDDIAPGASISQVMHKVLIEVGENGTTSTTDASCEYRCPPDNVDFLADHPFMFLITKDLHPLFIGTHY
ncbi:hypothetical protein L3Y34_006246 [Caenorhabditis briggsae]|uniref:Serpin domain-containing protein n=1 Tax=Caenorhabditis briggsae TaxID=6238 RepID=A0AAE9A3I5_CAEBR|nr:hypothetical protein L3Y34_006246 [Caenorhabditis briggsae]